MHIVVIGHGMVGHKFLETLAASGATGLRVTVLGEEPRPAYDRVHLSEFFAGKSAADLSLVAPGFFERDDMVLHLNAKVVGIDRVARQWRDGERGGVATSLPEDARATAPRLIDKVIVKPGKG